MFTQLKKLLDRFPDRILDKHLTFSNLVQECSQEVWASSKGLQATFQECFRTLVSTFFRLVPRGPPVCFQCSWMVFDHFWKNGLWVKL